MAEITMEQLTALLTVAEVAEIHDVPTRVVRKAARKGGVPGQIKVLGKFGFDPDKVSEWVPPEAGERRVGIRREDGRQRYRIYLTAEEHAKLQAEGYELADPRAAAKERRAARKAEKAAGKPSAEGTTAEVAESEDPFADFGTE